MMESAVYVVERSVAERSGMLATRYRTADGRYILNDRDLSRVRLTPDEYIHGLQGVEKITESEAETLIRQNDYLMGDDILSVPGSTAADGQPSEEVGETPSEGEEMPAEASDGETDGEEAAE